MKIENSFTIDAPVDDAWAMLTDIPEIAPCLPGAKLTDETDGVYTGSVKVKVGPVTAEYKGTAEFVERDDQNHKAVIDGKGRDSRGAGNAQALITAEMFDEGNGQTRVDISTDLKITGKVAQFGRGVMQDVSEKLLGQFAECLATKFEGTSALEDIAAASAEADNASSGAAGAADAGAETAPSAEVTTSAASGDDDDALDLLDVAGGAVFKRLIPVALLVAVIVIVLILVL
ncbi:MAG: SRPBCC family protein [Actinomycetota bacterium]